MNILLTGGMGYIGSHTAVLLAEAGHKVHIYDNLCNSNIGALDRINKLTDNNISFTEGDVRDTALLISVMRKEKTEAVIHLAGLKAVGESSARPVDYYSNNVQGTISLIQAMQASNIKILVFSSSATVYGDPSYLPYDEDHPTSPTNPYGRNKLQTEELLRDLAASDKDWRIACLRYFNPVGEHDSGLIGEDPNGMPNNLMPVIGQVATGKLKILNIFGGDYNTPDGTGKRDYIHVMDLSEGHLTALQWLINHPGCHQFNLGSGVSHSVLELLHCFETVSGQKIPYQIVGRRQGDLPDYYAKANKAKNILGWETKRDLMNICQTTWLWIKNSKVH